MSAAKSAAEAYPLVGRLGDPEIDHLGNRRPLVLHHQNVRRLEVAVDHALLVGMLHRATHGEEQFQPFTQVTICRPA
jgi:hypothetical protein